MPLPAVALFPVATCNQVLALVLVTPVSGVVATMLRVMLIQTVDHMKPAIAPLAGAVDRVLEIPTVVAVLVI